MVLKVHLSLTQEVLSEKVLVVRLSSAQEVRIEKVQVVRIETDREVLCEFVRRLLPLLHLQRRLHNVDILYRML